MVNLSKWICCGLYYLKHIIYTRATILYTFLTTLKCIFSHLSYSFLCNFLPLFIVHFFHSFIFVRIALIFVVYSEGETFLLLCAWRLNKWAHLCYGLARVLIRFFKIFFLLLTLPDWFDLHIWTNKKWG